MKLLTDLKKQSTHEFLINDEMISDPIMIANKFNQYFAHIGSTLADKIPAAPHFNSYLSNTVDSVFSFHTVTEKNISHIINKLKNKVRYGHDSISNIMIKRPHEPLIKSLTLSDPGYFRQLTKRGGGDKTAPPPYDLENDCVNLHYIIHVHFTRCFRHVPIGIF